MKLITMGVAAQVVTSKCFSQNFPTSIHIISKNIENMPYLFFFFIVALSFTK